MDIGRLLLLLLTLVTMDALLAVLALFLPGVTGRARTATLTMPGRVFALGLVNALFFGAIALVLAAIGDQLPGIFNGLFVLAALLVAFFLLALGLIGVAGQVRLLRSRIGAEPVGLGGLLRAGGVLLLAAAAPIVGWFILTPLLLLMGLGSTIAALVAGVRARGQTSAGDGPESTAMA